MKTSRSRISKTIANRILKVGNSKKLSTEIAAYLLAENQTKNLDSILRDIQLTWANEGYVEVIATSSFPLDAKTKASIGSRIKKVYPAAKQVIVTEVRDSSVIGGVKLSLANQQLDLSMEAKLNKFKQLTITGKV
jgi:F0F1-type ATP synthase delta subunit